MKNILHTNLPAVRHERGRGDYCSLTPDQLTTNDTPTPAFQPTTMNTTLTAWLARHALILSMYLVRWSIQDRFVITVNRRAFFLRKVNRNALEGKIEWHKTTNYFNLYKKVIHMVGFDVFFQDFFFLLSSLTNYKLLAAEKINHGVSWVITQIHAKSFTAKW